MTTIVNIADVPMTERPHVRRGVFRSRHLLAGVPGDPGNFALQLVAMPETYYSPRHRHNFDQIRYQIEGTFDFDADGRMGPGSIAYFPEGTRYGPQSSDAPSLTLVLQFGGASGSGFIAEDQYQDAAARLAETGHFHDGVYTTTGADGRKTNTDAFEAVWEYVNGRRLDYPEPRYARPVFMHPDNFVWVPDFRDAGVWHKPLGTFTERRTGLALHRLGPGAALTVAGDAILFVAGGGGHAAGTACDRHAAIRVEAGGTVTFQAGEAAELLEIRLPGLPQV